MRMAKSAFKQLQQEWYQKLADSGFIDAEEFSGGELRLKQHAHHVYNLVDDFTREIKEEYFTRLGHKVSDPETSFKKETHKAIMILASEGVKLKTICEKVGIDRNSARFIIRRYEAKWQIRTYDQSQLAPRKKQCLPIPS